MEFANFALIELAGAQEAQRAYDRRKGKWLLLWRQLQEEGGTAPASDEAGAPESLRTAA